MKFARLDKTQNEICSPQSLQNIIGEISLKNYDDFFCLTDIEDGTYRSKRYNIKFFDGYGFPVPNDSPHLLPLDPFFSEKLIIEFQFVRQQHTELFCEHILVNDVHTWAEFFSAISSCYLLTRMNTLLLPHRFAATDGGFFYVADRHDDVLFVSIPIFKAVPLISK